MPTQYSPHPNVHAAMVLSMYDYINFQQERVEGTNYFGLETYCNICGKGLGKKTNALKHFDDKHEEVLAVAYLRYTVDFPNVSALRFRWNNRLSQEAIKRTRDRKEREKINGQ